MAGTAQLFASSHCAARGFLARSPLHETPVPELDTLDRRILALYQGDTRMSAQEIGAEVGLSTAAVHRRLKRLREERVIEQEVAILNATALGYPVTCVVNVDIDREGLVEIGRFQARMTASPMVQQCYYVTGEADFVLVVVAPSMAAFEAFTREQLLTDSNVRSFTTHVVLARVKAGAAIPIRCEAGALK